MVPRIGHSGILTDRVLYILNANVLINANRDYYPLERVPEFWDWLIAKASEGSAKLPVEVYEEVAEGKDALARWLKAERVKSVLLLDEEAEVKLVSRVVEEGYATDLTDEEVEEIGRDPFLVAYALADTKARCVVTAEVSKPSKQRANRRLPDVCRGFGVDCCNTFEFLRRLDFSTGWRSAT